jgi:hypothetical protein
MRFRKPHCCVLVSASASLLRLLLALAVVVAMVGCDCGRLTGVERELDSVPSGNQRVALPFKSLPSRSSRSDCGSTPTQA